MKKKNTSNDAISNPPIYGNPVYPAGEDIYARGKKLELTEEGDESDDVFDHEINPGADLDIPGMEMDDADEKTGNEDEENNYYSIGSDNHNDLEEDKDEE